MYIGTDIIEIQRFEKLTAYESGLCKIFTKRELELTKDLSYAKRLETLAGKFAGKEATVKALGTGFDRNISFKDIEILKNEKGKPILNLYNKAKELSDELAISEYNISISHCSNYAIAMVVLT
jgi:holo-[acyl-carrier protein] synthase